MTFALLIKSLIKFKTAKTFVKLQFVDIESAIAASDFLWEKTNIYAFYHHHTEIDKSDQISYQGSSVRSRSISTGSSTSTLADQEGHTIHVQSLDRDLVELTKFFRSLEGITLIGYHKKFLFLRFETPKYAVAAVAYINQFTRMVCFQESFFIYFGCWIKVVMEFHSEIKSD